MVVEPEVMGKGSGPISELNLDDLGKEHNHTE